LVKFKKEKKEETMKRITYKGKTRREKNKGKIIEKSVMIS
jgi:hypothetical protein